MVFWGVEVVFLWFLIGLGEEDGAFLSTCGLVRRKWLGFS